MSRLMIEQVQVTPFEQNCALMWDEASLRGVVVDPGGDVPKIVGAIEASGLRIDAIWITHGHIDHVGGVSELAAQLEVSIIGPHKADAPLCDGIEKQAQMFGLGAEYKNCKPDRWLEEGEFLEIGPHRFEVLHCPGHAPGHVVFVNHEAKFIHAGDVLFHQSIGRTDLPGGSHETLLQSIQSKLLVLDDDYQFISGHGPASSIGIERQNNPFLEGLT